MLALSRISVTGNHHTYSLKDFQLSAWGLQKQVKLAFISFPAFFILSLTSSSIFSALILTSQPHSAIRTLSGLGIDVNLILNNLF